MSVTEAGYIKDRLGQCERESERDDGLVTLLSMAVTMDVKTGEKGSSLKQVRTRGEVAVTSINIHDNPNSTGGSGFDVVLSKPLARGQHFVRVLSDRNLIAHWNPFPVSLDADGVDTNENKYQIMLIRVYKEADRTQNHMYDTLHLSLPQEMTVLLDIVEFPLESSEVLDATAMAPTKAK